MQLFFFSQGVIIAADGAFTTFTSSTSGVALDAEILNFIKIGLAYCRVLSFIRGWLPPIQFPNRFFISSK